MKQNIGFIGIGNMGKLLIETWIQHGALQEEQIWINNRTMEKTLLLQEKYPAIHLDYTKEEILSHCEIIFLCAKPIQIIEIAKDIAPYTTPEQMVISITSPISVKDLERILPCQTARMIPSIVNRAGKGVSLLTFGNRCTETIQKQLTDLWSAISVPLRITDHQVRISSDLSSCGPAFIAHLIELMIQAAAEVTAVKKEEALCIIEETLIGLGYLLERKIFSLSELIETVCVKGGITGEGIRVIDNEIGLLFHHLFQTTNEKFQDDLMHIKKLCS